MGYMNYLYITNYAMLIYNIYIYICMIWKVYDISYIYILLIYNLLIYDAYVYIYILILYYAYIYIHYACIYIYINALCSYLYNERLYIYTYSDILHIYIFIYFDVYTHVYIYIYTYGEWIRRDYSRDNGNRWQLQRIDELLWWKLYLDELCFDGGVIYTVCHYNAR
jgi:hypothetical protein